MCVCRAHHPSLFTKHYALSFGILINCAPHKWFADSIWRLPKCVALVSVSEGGAGVTESLFFRRSKPNATAAAAARRAERLASHTEASDDEDEDELGFSSDTSAPRPPALAAKAASSHAHSHSHAAAAGAGAGESPVLSAASSHSSARSGGRHARRAGSGPEEIPLTLLELSVDSSSSHPSRPLQAPLVSAASVSTSTASANAAAAAAAQRARGGPLLPRIEESADASRVWEPADPDADIRSPSTAALATAEINYDSMRRNRVDLLAMKDPPSLNTTLRHPAVSSTDESSLGSALVSGDSLDVSAASGFGPALTCTKGPLLTQVAASRSPNTVYSTISNSQLATSLITPEAFNSVANPYNQTWSTGSMPRQGPLKSCLKPPTKRVSSRSEEASGACDSIVGDAENWPNPPSTKEPVTEYYVSLNTAAPPPGFQNDDVPMDPKAVELRSKRAAGADAGNEEDENQTLLHNFPPRRSSPSPNVLNGVRSSLPTNSAANANSNSNSNSNGGNDSSGFLSNSTSSNTVRSPSDLSSALLTHPDNLAGLGWPRLPTPELLASASASAPGPRAALGASAHHSPPPLVPPTPPTALAAVANHLVPPAAPDPNPTQNHNQMQNANAVHAPGMFVPALGIRWPLFSLLMSFALLSLAGITTLAYVDPPTSFASGFSVLYRERAAPKRTVIHKAARASRSASASGGLHAGVELNVTLFMPASLGIGRVRIISAESARLTIDVGVDASSSPFSFSFSSPSRVPVEVLELSGEWPAPAPWAQTIEALEYRRETPACSNCSHGCDPLAQRCLCPPGFQLESPSSTRCVGTHESTMYRT